MPPDAVMIVKIACTPLFRTYEEKKYPHKHESQILNRVERAIRKYEAKTCNKCSNNHTYMCTNNKKRRKVESEKERERGKEERNISAIKISRKKAFHCNTR